MKQSKVCSSDEDVSNDWEASACDKAINAWNMKFKGER